MLVLQSWVKSKLSNIIFLPGCQLALAIFGRRPFSIVFYPQSSNLIPCSSSKPRLPSPTDQFPNNATDTSLARQVSRSLAMMPLHVIAHSEMARLNLREAHQ